ncbi:MAG: hypothetical protein PWQ31_526 [Eubacteriales bacterium]|nr:hypothetical protein [Eubacteriales bacterium]
MEAVEGFRRGTPGKNYDCAVGPAGGLNPRLVEEAINKSTRVIVLLHASNVTGMIIPVAEGGAVARRHGIPCWLTQPRQQGFCPLMIQGLKKLEECRPLFTPAYDEARETLLEMRRAFLGREKVRYPYGIGRGGERYGNKSVGAWLC